MPDTPITPVDADYDDMHHALGRCKVCPAMTADTYRNHFCVPVGSAADNRFRRLGWWDPGVTINGGADRYWTVNAAGLEALRTWMERRSACTVSPHTAAPGATPAPAADARAEPARENDHAPAAPAPASAAPGATPAPAADSPAEPVRETNLIAELRDYIAEAKAEAGDRWRHAEIYVPAGELEALLDAIDAAAWHSVAAAPPDPGRRVLVWGDGPTRFGYRDERGNWLHLHHGAMHSRPRLWAAIPRPREAQS